jgi:TetR/AcrR family transcriptional repressor of nem operon
MLMEQSTSEKILDIAQSRIIAGGYNGFSYADISDAIGIRKASIHHHFPTKAELVSALVGRYTGQVKFGLGGVLEQIPQPAAQLDAYVGHWQKCIADASLPFCMCAMLASEIQMLPPDVAALVRGHFEYLARWLETVLDAGARQNVFRLNASPEAHAQIFMASVHGAMLSARALDKPELFAAVIGPQVAALKA